MDNSITRLFRINYPIVQAGMVWCSGWKLASAVSGAGGLGIIGAGSMTSELLDHHIKSYRNSCSKPFAVNLPLLYNQVDEQVKVILKNKVPVVFTSAGNPSRFTSIFKKEGIKVVHVVSSLKFALKARDSGVDAVVAEGFEAGGHNGRDETTTLCLIPMISEALDIPVIAAGGIASGKAMLATFALGAEGIQIGSRFAVTEESSAHINYKMKVIAAGEGDTVLTLKKLTPVRLIKNNFFDEVFKAERDCASEEELRELLGKGRARKGIFEGELEAGELEAGQVSALIKEIKPAAVVVREIWEEFLKEKERLKRL